MREITGDETPKFWWSARRRAEWRELRNQREEERRRQQMIDDENARRRRDDEWQRQEDATYLSRHPTITNTQAVTGALFTMGVTPIIIEAASPIISWSTPSDSTPSDSSDSGSCGSE
jgi:hypothetical protein